MTAPGPGRHIEIGLKTSPQRVDWATLDAAWAMAGTLDVYESMWMNDHLTDMDPVVPGPSLEALTLLATLVHRVPGKWVAHGVLSNTFRHPVLVAKAATVLDRATNGRFRLGLGAGWYEGEHVPFGIPLPPIGERIDRLESAVGVLRALFSEAAYAPPGVTRPDPFYPLAGAVNLPPPTRPGGPPIYLGGQKRRGIALAAREADGWAMPGTHSGNVPYFADRRSALLAEMERIGRDPAGFAFVGQLSFEPGVDAVDGTLETGLAFARAGATEIVIGVPAAGGAEVVRDSARDVAVPLRDALG